MKGVVLTALLLASALTALAHYADRPEGTWHRIRREGVVRIGYAPEPPFAFRLPDGRVTGEAPEIARAVFARLGVRRIEWVQAEFRALIPELQAGRFDVAAAGMYITPERSRLVAFSLPTFATSTALLVPADSAAVLCGIAPLRRRATARLAVLEGAVEGALAREAGFPAHRLLLVPDLSTGLQALRTGEAQALAMTQVTLRDAARREPGFAAVFPLCDSPAVMPPTGEGAFAFRLGDPLLRRAVDEELRRFVGSPAHLRLVAPFGITRADLPRRVTP
ncbi:MAG TPA: ectoine/hydroxyectoine ABC transporter substrate-binding protein EhuB [Gemmatimonadaceae bacterium]